MAEFKFPSCCVIHIWKHLFAALVFFVFALFCFLAKSNFIHLPAKGLSLHQLFFFFGFGLVYVNSSYRPQLLPQRQRSGLLVSLRYDFNGNYFSQRDAAVDVSLCLERGPCLLLHLTAGQAEALGLA